MAESVIPETVIRTRAVIICPEVGLVALKVAIYRQMFKWPHQLKLPGCQLRSGEHPDRAINDEVRLHAGLIFNTAKLRMQYESRGYDLGVQAEVVQLDYTGVTEDAVQDESFRKSDLQWVTPEVSEDKLGNREDFYAVTRAVAAYMDRE